VRLYEDFERDSGTYLKVIRFSEPTNPDGFVVLYLRPKGRFLLVGYWRGYEHSAAAGTWERKSSEVHLKGKGRLSLDTPAFPPDGGRFERIFNVEIANHTPGLTAAGELEGWSLLGWPGPFFYVGQQTIIDPDGAWMPNSLSKVDEWISKVSGEQRKSWSRSVCAARRTGKSDVKSPRKR